MDGATTVQTALVRDDPSDPTSLEPREQTVPADWHAAVSRAFAIHDRIADLAVPGYLGSAVVPGPLDSGSASVSIRVDVEDARRAWTRLVTGLATIVEEPERLLEGGQYGIDVSVEGIQEVQEFEAEPGGELDPHLVDDELVDDGLVPGGVQCQTEASSATLTPAVYHPDVDRPLFATARHAYEGIDEPAGETLYLPREGDEREELGRVRQAYSRADLAVVEPEGRLRPGTQLQGGPDEPVVGQYTRIGLAELAARGATLEKVGATTVRTTGAVEGVDAVTCLTERYCRTGQLIWGDETDMSDGDSGAVCYDPDPAIIDDGVLVASVTNARTWWPGQNFMWGIAAHELTDRHGLHF